MTEYLYVDDRLIVASTDVDLLKREYESGNPVLLIIDENNQSKDTSFIRFATILENSASSGTSGKVTDVIETDYLRKIIARHDCNPLTICTTERLYVREMAVSDANTIGQIYDESDGYLEPFFDDRCHIPDYLKEYCNNVYDLYGFGLYAVCLKENDTVMGIAGFTQNSELKAEIGYGFLKEYREKGYAYEACRALIDYMKNQDDDFECYARVSKNNQRGKKLAEKLSVQVVEF